MPDTVGIGLQDFGKLRKEKIFYVDKTDFIREWWESKDDVTLITRPRRFGKTLMMSMLDYFLSVDHKEDARIFEGLDIWKDEKYRSLQGTYPVIFLSFADVKETGYTQTVEQIKQILTDLVDRQVWQKGVRDILTENENDFFQKVQPDMKETVAKKVLQKMSEVLMRHYGKKAVILLDEYDTPMQEAYVNGFWDELVSFTRGFFNATFKTNPYLERAVMTGITRVSRESIFSDLNNLRVITTVSAKYETAFGFTEDEVFKAMDTYGYKNKEEVKHWYDGFTFGMTADIYNPWSVINFLESGELEPYWANTSSNGLVDSLVRRGSRPVKLDFETLLRGGAVTKEIDREVVFGSLRRSETAVWSLLLAAGYLKTAGRSGGRFSLSLTNYEVQLMFEKMVHGWFDDGNGDYNEFLKALLAGDTEGMNEYMGGITESVFSYFDVGGPSRSPQEKGGRERPASEWKKPERFYHGFVLGLLVDLSGRYEVTSNRESGLGRYDVVLCPLNGEDDAIIIEFKAQNPKKGENTLEDTVAAALEQIGEKKYESSLIARGVPEGKIRKYGFAFCGKKVLIG